ncbi:hypothetical protein AOQ84DRAFT_32957 [Glonium stellatum]|uniref:Transmembrane protein n=1 Tax=Glonium stellatum TaxID=574774 RepID=A0A8E2F1K2_9PEZI|nr:hypothetical protein AOQ84DRAFT_32957 [Glonium stellatum]
MAGPVNSPALPSLHVSLSFTPPAVVTDPELCITSGSWRITLPYQSAFLSFARLFGVLMFFFFLRIALRGRAGWLHEGLLVHFVIAPCACVPSIFIRTYAITSCLSG